VAFAPEALVEPVDMLSYTFSSLGEYRAVVAALPENTAESPYEISLTGIAFEDLWEGYDPLGQIFSVQGGRYLALDLSGCTGTAIGSLDDPAHIYWDGSLARSIGGNQDKGSIQSNSRERERVVSLVLPESLECIGDFTFAWFRYLKSVALPESLKVIGHGAFKYAGFTSVEIPDSVERIGIHAFGGGGTSKNLKSVKLPSSLKEIGAWAFSEQPLSSIELPHGLEVIGEHAFASLNSELRSISIPDTVTTIGMQAFWCTKQLESITLPASLTSLGSNVFSFSGIKSADFSACVNLENLYGYLFNECLSLTEVKVPPNVKYLYGEVFIDSNLRFLDLPASVEEVSYDTFGRSNIGTLILRSVTPPTIRPIIYTPYEGESKLLTHPPIILPMQVIYVPDESLQAYREADEWSESAAKFRGLSEYPG
jgi:hypothetical protein